MGLRGGALSAVALLAMIGGCDEEVVGYWPDAEMTIGKDVASSEPSGDGAGPTDDTQTADTAGNPAAITGIACEVEEDCETEFCLNDEFLASFGLTITVPGGMCSVFGCSGDEECGAGALCVDGAPFGASGISLCLATCSGLSDCRWEADWACYEVPAEPGEDPPESPLEVCLPDNIIVEAETADDESAEGSR